MKECLPPGQHVRVPPVRTASYPQYVGHTNTLKTVFEACVCMWHFSRERLQQTYFHSHTLVNHSADTHMQRKHADKSECYHTRKHKHMQTVKLESETMSLMVPFDTVPLCGLTLICVCPQSFADICRCNTDPPGLRNLLSLEKRWLLV